MPPFRTRRTLPFLLLPVWVQWTDLDWFLSAVSVTFGYTLPLPKQDNAASLTRPCRVLMPAATAAFEEGCHHHVRYCTAPTTRIYRGSTTCVALTPPRAFLRICLPLLVGLHYILGLCMVLPNLQSVFLPTVSQTEHLPDIRRLQPPAARRTPASYCTTTNAAHTATFYF